MDEILVMAELDNIKNVSKRDFRHPHSQEDWGRCNHQAANIPAIAHRAGIKVLSTGGSGVFHRGPVPDISAGPARIWHALDRSRIVPARKSLGFAASANGYEETNCT